VYKRQELGSPPQRGAIRLQRSAYTSNEVTAVVAVTGDVAGMVLFAMDEATARGIVSRMMGQDFPEFDALAQSGIAELGNVITGRAAVLLSEAGVPSDLAPPMLLVGRGTIISTLDVQRIVVPIERDRVWQDRTAGGTEAVWRGRPPRSLTRAEPHQRKC
jgi:chemotaxis protein CheX